MPRPSSYAVSCLKKTTLLCQVLSVGLPVADVDHRSDHHRHLHSLPTRRSSDLSKGPKPLQLKLLTTYIPKTSAFTLAFSTSQRLRTTRASARTFFTFRHYITPSARNF